MGVGCGRALELGCTALLLIWALSFAITLLWASPLASVRWFLHPKMDPLLSSGVM